MIRAATATGTSRPLSAPPSSAVAAVVVLALLSGLVLTGCRSFVFAPDPDGEFAPAKDDRATVWLIEEGVHTGLALPHPDEGLVEYGYGEWSWYAEGKAGFFEAIPSMLWETQGTIGRRSLAVSGRDIREDPGAWYRQRQFDVRMSPLVVSRGRAAALQQRLDGIIDGAPDDERKFHNGWEMEFAKAGPGFCLFCNCSDVVTDWLRELGCTVTPALVRGSLQVAGPREHDIIIRDGDDPAPDPGDSANAGDD